MEGPKTSVKLLASRFKEMHGKERALPGVCHVHMGNEWNSVAPRYGDYVALSPYKLKAFLFEGLIACSRRAGNR